MIPFRPVRRLLLAALLTASAGCGSPVTSPHALELDSRPELTDPGARDAARAWLARAGIDLDHASTEWGTLVPTDRGYALAARQHAGRADTGAAVMNSYYFHFEDGSIVSAWGPRALGSGCTCHYPAVSRIPAP